MQQTEERSRIEEVRNLLADVLSLGERGNAMDADTVLLGSLPELDSMAVISVISAIEEFFGITVDDDDINARTFQTLGSLTDFVNRKLM